MTSRRRAVSVVVGLVLLTGCASTKVMQKTPLVSPELARPERIWVYDFIADPAEIPADSSIRGDLTTPSKPLTAKQLETGRQLGAQIARDLAADINAMGLSAAVAGPRSTRQVGDGVIRGYLVSVQGGSTVKRFAIGLGAGSSELETVVEGYVQTPGGLRKLGSGTLSSSGSKTPGVVAPAAIALGTGNPIGLIVVGGTKLYGEVSGKNSLEARAKATADAIAEQLRIRFRDRGWIS
jgi:hypothetical protein